MTIFAAIKNQMNVSDADKNLKVGTCVYSRKCSIMHIGCC